MSQRLDPTETHRTCKGCGRDLPLDAYYRIREGYWYRTCKRCKREADNRKARKRGARVRHPRTNARGQVRCGKCHQYLDASMFRKHPNRPGTHFWMCTPCSNAYDRERYAQRNRDLERALRDLDRRTELKRKHAGQRMAERRRFLVESIRLLRSRGLTKTEICRLADVTLGNLLKWERGSCQHPTQAVCNRFSIVVRETGELPKVGPVVGRRRPHPAMGELLARCLPQVQAIPTRNGWKNGARS